jgi:hypothetical protein
LEFSDEEQAENNSVEKLENDAEEQLHTVEEQKVENDTEKQPCIAEIQQTEEEDEEFHDFPSEYSSGHSTPETEPSALEFTMEKLFEMMRDGFHGCSADEHTLQLQELVTRDAANHHGLGALFSTPTFPSVHSLSEYITSSASISPHLSPMGGYVLWHSRRRTRSPASG